MLVTFIVVVTFVLVVLFDLLPQWKNWEKGVKIVYVTTLALGFAGLLLHSLYIKIPSVTDGITQLVDALFPNIK